MTPCNDRISSQFVSKPPHAPLEDTFYRSLYAVRNDTPAVMKQPPAQAEEPPLFVFRQVWLQLGLVTSTFCTGTKERRREVGNNGGRAVRRTRCGGPLRRCLVDGADVLKAAE